MKYFCSILIFIFSFSIFSQEIVISAGPKDNIYIVKATPIIREVYKKLGYTLTIKNNSFEGSLISSSSGESDGELFRFKSVADNYPSLLIVDEPLFSIETIAFTKDKNIKIESWGGLAKYRIAYVRGIKSIEKRTENMNAVITNTHEKAFELLDKNRVEVVISGKETGLKIIKELGLKNILADNILDSVPAYHLIHEKNRDILKSVENSLREIKKRED